MSSYTVRIGEMDLGTTDDPAAARAMLAEGRHMQRWVSHYGEALSLTVDGQTIDTTDQAELDRLGVGD